MKYCNEWVEFREQKLLHQSASILNAFCYLVKSPSQNILPTGASTFTQGVDFPFFYFLSNNGCYLMILLPNANLTGDVFLLVFVDIIIYISNSD